MGEAEKTITAVANIGSAKTLADATTARREIFKHAMAHVDENAHRIV